MSQPRSWMGSGDGKRRPPPGTARVTNRDPAISVIVCTYDRPHMLKRALLSVLDQDVQDFEVLVVDDGSATAPEIPPDPLKRIRVIRLEHRGVGSARAAGLEAARGTFIAYCDDDDEWRRNHLRVLLDFLLKHRDVELVYGDSEWRGEGMAPWVPYSNDFDVEELTGDNYIFASDVLHRADVARAMGGFNDKLLAYEDWDLWLRMSQRGVFRHLPIILGTHHWHEGCVSADDHWETRDLVYWHHQSRLAFLGVEAQHDIAASGVKLVRFDPETWRPGRRELIWYSDLQPDRSFGYVSRQLLGSLERIGVDITMPPTRNQARWGFDRFFKPLTDWSRLGFYYRVQRQPGVLKCERLVAYSMWESTAVPRKQVREINEVVRLLYVPCRQNLESYRDCGVAIDIKVLHHGVDENQFPYLERGRRDVFTFGTFGVLTPRKGIDVLLRAFHDEFRSGEPVRLLMKSVPPADLYERADARVVLVSGFMDRPALLGLLRQIDVFVLPSRGEGFGLTGLEAMSTGLPLIATAWSGPAEYLDPADSLPLSYRLVDAAGTEVLHWRYFGQWAEPDYEHLRWLLRWSYEHPTECAEMGRRAAKRVRAQWTWERVARQICGDLDVLSGA